MVTLSEKWELESIFPGGSESQVFLKFVEKLEEDITEVTNTVHRMGSTLGDHSVLIGFLRDIQNLMLRTKHASSFTYCMTSQDVTDQKAKSLHGRSKQNEANLQILLFKFAEKISEIHPEQWQELVSISEIRPIRFPLDEMRQQVIERLPSSQEELIDDFAVEGYHSWMSLYTALIRRMRIPFEQEGKTECFSVERLEGVFFSSNRQEREQAFFSYSEAFRENEEVFSSILNNLAGFRLKMYKHRGWNSVLKESLGLNRMSQPTLESMWEAVASSREKFSHYFKRKAELMGIDKMSWFDFQTSISDASSILNFTDGVNFILERFRGFSPKMAEFAAKAFEEKWVEAENRPQKSPMGFHTGFPLIKQSRIFKTYFGTAQNIATLAHELGHGYHQYIISDMPPLAQKYGLNLAETASIFSELLVMNGFIEMETSKSEQIALLDSKIKMNAEYFFNVYTCYLFEEKFYAERKAGPLSPHRLNELMIEAQKAAYGDVFETYNAYFWASKFHLYITKSSFFNFPYTFGFLFSSGIYAKSLEEGKGFEVTYENLLRESASMTVEELAAKHLGVDLREAEFWENAVRLVMSDIDKFLELTEKDE
ncbi:M3 family oligoendopeptidase [Paenibacillus eucommiae]|uniref:PepF/M3 family oligoendopeptidase n=1 Tax=Paenibacillus eucommiae TaxID=1355755 RepID=A0ABS4J6C6_9BACL|nr:M3 family oligoendopeptidase [Paenibacillus eucommiae]MBP1994676.1 pepF/M3 family oligoendopeptidase [Paenibacillus eucommiae]